MTVIRSALSSVVALVLSVVLAATAQVTQAGPFPASPCFPTGFYPCFGVDVSVTGTSSGEFSLLPVIESVSGSPGGGGTENAFGSAAPGSVGSKSSVNAPGFFGGGVAQSTAEYDDTFVVNFFGVGFAILTVDVSLTGTLSVTGGNSFARVGATLVLWNVDTGDRQVVFLSGPGTASASVFLFPGPNDILLAEALITFAQVASSPGSALADFSTTFDVTGVELSDSSGNFLQDLILTDTAGFTIPPSAPPTAPEPATLLLVAIALAGLGAASRRRARTWRRNAIGSP